MSQHLIAGKEPRKPFSLWASVRSILLMSPMVIGVWAASAVEGFWVSSGCVIGGLLVSLLFLWKAGAVDMQGLISITSAATEPSGPSVHSKLSTLSNLLDGH